jgi:predicted NBD/HSP70 family sugar kinase
MPKDSLTSNNSSPRRQKAAERTGVNLLRYMLDHPNSTCRAAADDLGMSFPNVCRLVSDFKAAGILLDGEYKQTGRRGPWSQAVMLRPELGCTIGVDLEATRVRGLVLDFGGNAVTVVRKPIIGTSGLDEIVSSVAEVAQELVDAARARKLEVYAVGLGLPGPVVDVAMGRVRTHLQMGEVTVEFASAAETACGMSVVCSPNSYCFAAGHHRIHHTRETGIEMLVLNRFGLAATIVWDGRLYTGASHYAGDLGLLHCGTGAPGLRYKDVCTGSALLALAQRRDETRSFQELLQSPNDPLVQDWLSDAIPAFAQAIYAAVIAYNPDRVVIEGIFNKFPEDVRRRVIDTVNSEIAHHSNMVPPIGFFEGDDLLGARGAALLARDTVADEVLADLNRG